MNFLRTVLRYASSAWSVITGAAADPVQAFEAVWHFAGSIQSLLDNLVSIVVKGLLVGVVDYIGVVDKALQDYLAAIGRISKWIWGRQTYPVYKHLREMIIGVRKWATAWFAKLIAMIAFYYLRGVQYTNKQVSAEAKARAAAILQTRQYAIRLSKGVWNFVNRDASDGYNSQTRQRESVITRIADDLIVRNPVLKTAIGDMIKLALDAAEVEDPLLRLALGKALAAVIGKLGVDRVAGDLLSTLIAELTGAAAPTTLKGTTADIAGRLTALESQWADFMTSGGPELEQAGEAWKGYAGALGDAALVAFFGLAVSDPAAWAAGVNDSAGAIVNVTTSGVAALIKGA